MATINKERQFIIGLIEGKDRKGKAIIEAIQLYNPNTKQANIESLESLKKRLKRGEEIIGVRLNYVRRYASNSIGFELSELIAFDKVIYDYRRLSKLNGKGEVIEQGKDVVVGTKRIDDTLKFIVVSNNLDLRYLTREEVINEKLVGSIRDKIGKASQIEIA